MNPNQGWLGWYKLKALIAGQIDRVLESIGFWQLGFWGQIFAVVAVILVAVFILLGPLIFAAFRAFRSGERPGILGIVLGVIGAAGGSVILPLLGRLMQHVLERHPGPII